MVGGEKLTYIQQLHGTRIILSKSTQICVPESMKIGTCTVNMYNIQCITTIYVSHAVSFICISTHLLSITLDCNSVARMQKSAVCVTTVKRGAL